MTKDNRLIREDTPLKPGEIRFMEGNPKDWPTPEPARYVETILDKAKAAVYGDREVDYGPARHDMDRVARMWSVILGVQIRPEQVPLCMVALKIARLCHSEKQDSIVDIAGWAAVLERVINERAK